MNKEKKDILFGLGELEYSVSGDWLDYSQYNFNSDDVTDLIALTVDKELHYAEGDSVWVPVHAWRILGQLASEAAVLPLLGIFNFLVEEDDDLGMADLPHVMGMIGSTAIAPLTTFMNDKTHKEFARVATMESLQEIVKRHPESRAKVLAIYQSYMKTANADLMTMNGLLVSYLIDINGHELIEDIRTLFNKGYVDLSVSGDIEDVEIELGLRDERKTPKPTLEGMHGISSESMKDMTTEQLELLLSGEPPEKPKDKTDIIAWLDYYFLSYENDDSILDTSELDGFCASLACSPEVIMPSTWIPAIWGGEALMPEWKTMKEAQDFNEFLFTVYNHVIGSLNDNQFEALFWTNEKGGKTYNIVDEWCNGFLRGVNLWGSLPAIDIVEVEQSLESIRLFATESGFEKLKEMKLSEITSHQDLIEPAIQKLFDYFLEKRKEFSSPFVRDEEKVNRNDSCPCGSGKKYKKCCLH